MDSKEQSAVSEILTAARIPWSQLDCRTQRNDEGKVVKLRFSPCLSLEEIPRAIGDLSSLEEIYLFWASRRLTHLPSDGFDRLHNLRVLQIRWCQGIRELPRLCNSLEELVIEGCDDIVDLSCFRTAKRTWKKLRRLHIIQVGTRGIASLVDAFSTEAHGDLCDTNLVKNLIYTKPLNRIPPIFFPSLTDLSLRHNSIDQVELAKLWPFFRRCPRLVKIDLGNNRISSLENLVPVATAIEPCDSDTTDLFRMALRELKLAGNPVCGFSPHASLHSFDSDDADENDDGGIDNDGDGDGEIATSEGRIELAVASSATVQSRDKDQIPKYARQREHLLRIITATPQLVSILVCNGKCEHTINSSGSGCHKDHCLVRNRCVCFEHSALYSHRIRHALDLNQCSKGKTLMFTRAKISRGESCDVVSEPFSLSKWPFVLDRTNRISNYSPFIDGQACSSCHCRGKKSQGCPSETCNVSERALRERQASVIYTLLHGPVFAARWSL